MILVCHLVSCLWYMVGDLNANNNDNWIIRFNLVDKSNFEVSH